MTNFTTEQGGIIAGMKHVFITGGSDGLGKITAQKLVAAGYDVTILSRDEAKTKATAEEIGCRYAAADATDASQVKRAMEQAGEIDILINNAGNWLAGLLEVSTPEQIEKVIASNTLGTIYCTQAVVPAMKQRQSGRIINVISQAGLYAKAERSVYNASKWAITGFTKSLQAELKPSHISVVGFYPGAMATGLFAKAGDMKDRGGALDPAIAADALAYLCGLPDHVIVPEFGIESLDY